MSKRARNLNSAAQIEKGQIYQDHMQSKDQNKDRRSLGNGVHGVRNLVLLDAFTIQLRSWRVFSHRFIDAHVEHGQFVEVLKLNVSLALSHQGIHFFSCLPHLIRIFADRELVQAEGDSSGRGEIGEGSPIVRNLNWNNKSPSFAFS